MKGFIALICLFENVYTLQLLKYVLPLTASFFPEPMIKTGAFYFRYLQSENISFSQLFYVEIADTLSWMSKVYFEQRVLGKH